MAKRDYRPDDPWHYPRTALAERAFGLLESRLARALLLFAPRRTGKTEFLLKDLQPLALAKGHRVVYASFWQATLSPLAVLLYEFDRAQRQAHPALRVHEAVVRLVPKLRLSDPLFGSPVGAEIDLTQLTGPPPGEALLYLDQLMGRVADDRHPTLVLLDEVQELARSKDNEPLVAALRTSLDKRRDGLAAAFTGSSASGLRAMFQSREAPFFHFATPIDLPPLDEGFVDHLRAVFERATRRRLDRAALIEAFAELHRNPYFFRGLLERLMARPDRQLADVLADYREQLALELGYPQAWAQLSAIQRALLVRLAAGETKPYGAEARAALAGLTGGDAPTTAQVQAAMRTLRRRGLVEAGDGAWHFADPEFRRWISALPAGSV